jgi:Contractile injection system tube protein
MEISVITLHPLDSGVPVIQFQMNPTSMKRIGRFQADPNLGANNRDSGAPRLSFAKKDPNKIRFRSIIDNLESGRNVEIDLKPFHKAIEFIEELRRPPVYRCIWGEQLHLNRCFVNHFDYDLTMTGRNGVPLRAEIELELTEADDPNAQNQANQKVDPSQADRNVSSQALGLLSWLFFT